MLLYLSLFTIVLSGILVFFNWNLQRNAVYLGIFFGSFGSYGLTHFLTIYGKSAFWLAIFFNHFTPLWLLPGPMLYFYAKATLTDKNALSSKWDFLHFIPFLINLVGIVPYFFESFTQKEMLASTLINNIDLMKSTQINWIYTPIVGFIARPALLLCYGLVVLQMVWGKKYSPTSDTLSRIPQKQYRLMKRWIGLLAVVSSLAAGCFLILTAFLLEGQISNVIVDSMPLHFTVGLIFSLLSISLLLFPQVLYGIPVLEMRHKAAGSKKKEIKARKVVLEEIEEPFLPLATKIISYIETEKPFVHPDFSISHIAVNLNIPQHHIAYCFNNVLEKKFTALRAEWRVNYAKELLKDGLSETLSIDGIGYKAGFSTRSNFYSTFKSITGQTPSEYLEKLS